ncbi:MAG: hypothetical protein Fur0022_46460 [Anaerolineales bacterium]
MTPTSKDKLSKSERQATLHDLLQERMRLAIRHTLITVLEEEVEGFIQAALYQRTPTRRDYRNGHYERDLVTTVGELEDLPVPRTRHGFRTQLFERYQRRQAELDELIGEMFVQGVSTAQVGNLVEVLTGTPPALRRFRGCFIPWKASVKPGKPGNSSRIICTSLPTGRILRSFTTRKAAKCPFWRSLALMRKATGTS